MTSKVVLFTADQENVAPTSTIISSSKKIVNEDQEAKVIFADVTNSNGGRLRSAEQPKWCGTHIKFDEDGNEVVVIKEQPQENKKEEEVKAQEEEEVVEEEEVQEEEEEEKENEDSSLWQPRDSSSTKTPQPKWCGKKFIYTEDGEEIEQKPLEEKDFDDKGVTPEVVAMVDCFETLSTKEEKKL